MPLELLSTGSQGIAFRRLMGRLNLDPKRFEKRMAGVAKRLGVIETDEQIGKNVMHHWTAPQALLQARGIAGQPVLALPAAEASSGQLAQSQSIGQVRKGLTHAVVLLIMFH